MSLIYISSFKMLEDLNLSSSHVLKSYLVQFKDVVAYLTRDRLAQSSIHLKLKSKCRVGRKSFDAESFR